ncbi:hypothetical protein G7Z17_g531 [Cylindrodendrum hubeiense]|uniref:FAD-binding domain-containing protein n=1 Tax=Cylindrodendrum hubeiense TaxID=595255 RepID=A0A9P5HGG2_9HYPO|nr:hypothetical protein G7Z17_g531 [Cylindrodendrum hubeiense]
MPFKIIIVGGSVAGLSLANMLEKSNIDYILLEGYPEIAPQVGASIGLLPNGLRILDQLGCYEAYRAKAEDQIYQQVYLRKSNGKIYGYQHDLMEMWLGYPMIFIDRQMLLQVLYGNLKHKEKVLTSQRVVSVDFTESGVRATTKDNNIYEGDLIIGADGIHSKIREEMWRNAPLGYFSPNEDTQIPASTKCIFGISKRPPGYPGASQQNTFNKGYSYYIMEAPGDRLYWFLFVELDPTLYGQDIPKDIYENRIVTTLAPLQTYVFKKWHYRRIITIGDSAHKVDPVTGQGGNGAIESGALLVNALLRKLDESPNGLREDQVESALAEVHAGRFDRAEDVVKQGYWLQDVFTKRNLISTLIARYGLPALGSFGVLYRGVEFCAPATSLERLEIPNRPRAVPFEDELPAKPVKVVTMMHKVLPIAFFALLCFVSTGSVHVPKKLETFIDGLSLDGDQTSMLPAITFVTNWACLLTMALVESNRVGNQLAALALGITGMGKPEQGPERKKFHNMFAKADAPIIKRIHYTVLGASAVAHMANLVSLGIGASLSFGGGNVAMAALGLSKYDGLIFTLSALVLSLGISSWNLRLSGYITTEQALQSALAIVGGICIAGPAATVAAVAIWLCLQTLIVLILISFSLDA